MQISLQNRTALITGGSRGIGQAIAQRFANSGATAVILGRRADVVAETVATFKKDHPQSPGRLLGYAADVTDSTQLEATVRQIFKEVGPVDILVNNAGSSARFPLMEVSRERLQADLDLKVFAAIQLSQLVLPHMRAQKWGRILNMTTTAGKAPPPGGAPTALSRAAGIILTKSMATEFAPDNVLVNTICLGSINSDQWRGYHQAEAPDMPFAEYLKSHGKGIPLGRVGEAEEVANLACFLASDAAAYITGTAINIDGGRSPMV